MKDMMRYLEAAKMQELVSQLGQEGYDVVREPAGEGREFDLIAVKGGRKSAIQVVARARLKEAREKIRQLQELAHERGFDEFRLVVVGPPHEVSVVIDGLEEALMEYLVNHVPEDLMELSSSTMLTGLSDIELDAVEIERDGIRVRGMGIIEVKLVYGGGEARDGVEWDDAYPFEFHLELEHDLRMKEVHELVVDTSSFSE